MFKAAREFNKTVWMLILATFFIKLTFLMAWPFLAIILYNKFGLNEFETGKLLAAGISVGIIFGFFVGNISDRIGRRKVILAGIVTSAIAMFSFAWVDSLFAITLTVVLGSVSRSMVEEPAKALMTDMLKTREAKDFSLHLRYFVLNIGSAIGPLLGVYLGVSGGQDAFYYIAIVYVVYFLIAAIIFKIETPKKVTKMVKDQSLRAMISTLTQDIPFLAFVVATFLMYLAFAQIDVGLLQYLRVETVPDYAKFYAFLIFVNGLTIITFQFPLLKLLKNVSTTHKSVAGLVLFVVSFLLFAFAPVYNWYGLIFAMFVLSIGEAILFPTISILIDRMAPEHLKGSYFGAAGFANFGWACAPVLGGLLLHELGGLSLWIVMALLNIVALVIFIRGRSNQLDNGEL